MDKHFCVGAFCFRLVCERDIDIPENFLLFENPGHNSLELTYHMTIADSFPSVDGTIRARRSDLIVYGTDAGEARLIGIKGQAKPYALYRELYDMEAEIFLAAEAVADLRFDPVFTSLFALERQMIRWDSMNPALCVHKVSWESNPVFCSIRDRKVYAGRTVGKIPGK